MSIFKEISDYGRLKNELSVQDNSIVFYAEHGGYFPYFEGIIEELINNYDKTLFYITSSKKDPILKNTNPKIRAFYLNNLLPFFMAFVDCKVFIMTLTDLDNYHLKRSINPVHYIYVFHGLGSTHMVVRHAAYDHYDCIFCAGPHQQKEIRKHEEIYNLPQKVIIETGYYRLERIYQDYHAYISNKSAKTDRKTILIAPSWGKDNILESCAEELFKLLLEEGYNVIVRPHPELMKRSPGQIAKLAHKFIKSPNFILEKSVSMHNSLLKADLLITDWSNISFEYALGTERPVMFIDVPMKVHNPRYMELDIEPLEISIRQNIGAVVSPDNLNIVPATINELLKDSSLYQKRLADLRNQYVYNFGKSSQIGAEYIAQMTEGKH